MSVGALTRGKESLVGREMMLPSGEVIRSEFRNESKNGEEPVPRYIIVDGTGKKRLASIASEELFEKIIDGAFEVFGQIFESLPIPTPMFANSLCSDLDRPHEALRIFESFESQGVFLTPVEAFFAALPAYKKYNRIEAEELEASSFLLQLVKTHVEMYDREVFDSGDKIWSYLDPWNVQLGLENHQLLLRVDFTIDDLIFLKANPHMFGLFISIMSIWQDTTIPPDCKMGDAESVENITMFGGDTYRHFKRLPFQHESFLAAVNELTLQEFKEVIEDTPNDDSAEIVNEILQNNVAAYRNKNDSKVAQRSFSLMVKLFSNIEGDFLPVHDSAHLSSTIVRTASKNSGYRKVTESLAYDSPNFFRDFQSVQQYNWNFLQGSHLWIENVKYKDYTLLKMCEKIGAEGTTLVINDFIEMANDTSVDERKPLTFNQWMEFADRYEELKDVPASWWSSLLC